MTIPPPGLLDWLVARAGEARREARWAESIAWAAIGLVEASRHRARTHSADLLNGLGAIAFERGEMRQAERDFSSARLVAVDAGYDSGEAAALINLGAVANVRGRFAEAVGYYRRGRWVYRRAANALGESRALNNLGMAFADLRRWHAAERCYRLARRGARTGGDANLLGIIALNETEVFLEFDHLRKARESCDEAMARLSGSDPPALAEAHRCYGRIYQRRGELKRAEGHLSLAARRGKELDSPLVEAEALRDLGHLHMSRGKHKSALECYGRSVRLFRAIEAARDLEAMREEIDQIETIIVRIVQELSREVEARDAYLYGHSSRVAEHAVAIACDLGFGPDEMKGILVAGTRHDVGKLKIDPAILDKEGRLTAEEMAEVRRHPVAGVEHLERFELPWDVEATVRGHHERYDGSGYPDGLAGCEIPLGARILLVADVFDALTTARPYRRPWSGAEALSCLEANAGTLADPEIVAVFREVARRRGLGARPAGDGDGLAVRGPETLPAAFAALPSPEEWERLEEELTRV